MPPRGRGYMPPPLGGPLPGPMPPILGILGPADGPLAQTLFYDGPDMSGAITAWITAESDSVTAAGVAPDVTLWHHALRPGRVAYFTLLPGLNQVQVIMLGLVNTAPGMSRSRFESLIVGTVGEAHGGQLQVVARVNPRDYGAVGGAIDIRLPPLRTVLGEYLSGAHALTEVFWAATVATLGSQMLHVPAIMFCLPRWAFRYLAEGPNLTPACVLLLTSELVETLDVADRPLADPLLAFFVAACSKADVTPQCNGVSAMRLPWIVDVPDQGLVEWWRQRVGALWPPSPPPPSPPLPVPLPSPAPAPAPAASQSLAKSKIPDIEKDWIREWSNLGPDKDLDPAW